MRAYFKGNGANTLKIAPETGLKLAFNDFFKHHYLSATQRPEDITPMARCVSGGLSGALAQGLLYPLDMIRTRLAVCTVRGNYKGIAQTARRILREEGPTAFYRGITPSMIGILPYSGQQQQARPGLGQLTWGRLLPHLHPLPLLPNRRAAVRRCRGRESMTAACMRRMSARGGRSENPLWPALPATPPATTAADAACHGCPTRSTQPYADLPLAPLPLPFRLHRRGHCLF